MDMDHAKNNGPSAATSSFAPSPSTAQSLEPTDQRSFLSNGANRPVSKFGHFATAFDDNSANPSPAQRSPTESTPDIANAISGRLVLESLTDDEGDEDSIMDDISEDVYFDELPPHGLPVSTLPTGLCYDERMRYHAEVATINESNYHPEDPRRIFYIYKELCQAGLVDDTKSRRPLVRQPLLRIDAREATEEECCLIHTPKHYEFVKSTSGEHQAVFRRCQES
jgi:hypothetical protein